MKIAAIIAMSSFPLWKDRFTALQKIAPEIYIRFDGINGDPEILRELLEMQKVKENGIMEIKVAQEPWNPPHWREDCLRMLDEVKPDIVIALDEDEEFEEGAMEEITNFANSDKLGMMFSYHPLVTNDGRVVNDDEPYPSEPHMKVFKWKPDISYWPYHGNAIIGRYVNPEFHWRAKSKLYHYCCYTRSMEKAKRFRNDVKGSRATKAVTLLGFGQTALELNNSKPQGEYWSLNDCYQSFSLGLMRHVTRIFDLHMEHKREFILARDGKPHFWYLDQLGRVGHRIILQRPHPQVTNSEAYPLYQVLSRFGIRYFTGSPAYLVAMAIMEGYNRINIFGFDQRDWEHTIQRECFIFWIALAMGRGIEIGGELTFLRRAPRLYGYEYGPEFDEQNWRELWDGYPFEIKIKGESRAVAGALFGGQK